MAKQLAVAVGAPSDSALLERAVAGDVAAFAEIYDRHAPTVLALARRILGHLGGAEDLLHDVFIEAWLAAREYDAERGSVRVWLLVRTRSRAFDRRERHAREHNVRDQAAQQGAHERVLAMPQTERQIAVRQALTTLSPAIRSTLELTFFEGMTALEIAAQMQVPEGTVRSRLAKGLELMERILGSVEESA